MSSFVNNDPSGLSNKILGPIEEPSTPNCIDLFEYWKSIKKGGSSPFKSDLKPYEIKNLLPFIFIYDILNDGEDFHLRLMGTKCVELVGEDYTGLKVTELPNTDNTARIELYKHVARTEKPYFIRATVGADKGFEKEVETLYLPLLDNKGVYKYILCTFDIV